MIEEKEHPSFVMPLLLGLCVVYFGFGLAIIVDELILRSHFIHQHTPVWLIEPIRIAYRPMIEIARLFI